MLRPEDKELLAQKGISEADAEAQLARFVTGFPYLKIKDAARVDAGIFRLSDEEANAALERWHEYLAHGGEVCKFVPASGALRACSRLCLNTLTVAPMNSRRALP